MNRLSSFILPRVFVAAACLVSFAFAARDARAETVTVQVNGNVEWNLINAPPLNGAHVGDAAKLTFTVDSNNWLNNPVYPTRGYPIDTASFKLTFPTFAIGLQNPYPAGQTPYFVIRNNDPAVDGFFVSTGTGFFDGVPLNQAGGFGQFANEFHVTYAGSTLASLDVLGALGHYDYTGLSVFNWTIDDGPVNALGIEFTDMTITVPEPASIAAMALVLPAFALHRRRRRI